MPAYNAAETIGAAISGVLTQDYPRVELIVIDDGSTDDTATIAEAYGDRVRLLRTTNGGTARARNLGLHVATGDFIATADADDILLPPYLHALYDAYTRAGGGRRLATTDAYLLTTGGVSHRRRLVGPGLNTGDTMRLSMLQRNSIPIFTFFPRLLLDEVGYFDETLRYREDWDLWLRAILRGWEVVYQDQPYALYRWTPKAKSTHPAGYLVEDQIMRSVQATYGESLSTAERDFLAERLRLRAPRLLEHQGAQALRDGDYATAKRLHEELASLSSEHPRVRAKSLLVSRVPGAARVMRHRLLRIDRELGRGSDETLR